MTLLTRLLQPFRAFHAVCLEAEARAAHADGRFSAALMHAQALLRLAPDHAWANFQLSYENLRAERYTDALDNFTRVARAWPEDARAFYGIGVCCDCLERPREAIAAYRRALVLRPGWHKALKNIGRDLYLLDQWAASDAVLRRYCAAAPEDKEAHDLLGYVCYRQGKFSDSYGHYEYARRLDPLNPKTDRNARLLYARSATS